MQLIVLSAFGAVDLSLASCMLAHFLEIKFEMIVGLQVWHNGEQLYHCFGLRFIYILLPHNMKILHFRSPYCHVSNSALYLYDISVISFYIDVVLTLSTDEDRFVKRQLQTGHTKVNSMLKCSVCYKHNHRHRWADIQPNKPHAPGMCYTSTLVTLNCFEEIYFSINSRYWDDADDIVLPRGLQNIM